MSELMKRHEGWHILTMPNDRWFPSRQFEQGPDKKLAWEVPLRLEAGWTWVFADAMVLQRYEYVAPFGVKTGFTANEVNFAGVEFHLNEAIRNLKEGWTTVALAHCNTTLVCLRAARQQCEDQETTANHKRLYETIRANQAATSIDFSEAVATEAAKYKHQMEKAIQAAISIPIAASPISAVDFAFQIDPDKLPQTGTMHAVCLTCDGYGKLWQSSWRGQIESYRTSLRRFGWPVQCKACNGTGEIHKEVAASIQTFHGSNVTSHAFTSERYGGEFCDICGRSCLGHE
jgi:hypothetical protein